MIAKGSSIYRPASPPRGLTLVEMVISMVLVGVGLVAALNAVGASKLAQFKVSVRRQGHLLAPDLMTEILLQDYADPVDGLDSFGLSAAEAATGDRSLFDDVDDYDGWSASPPQHQDGTDFVGFDGWERSVAVAWVNPSDPSQLAGDSQGVKRIIVMVKHNGILAAELVALKTIGLPPLEACCFDDGTCADLRVEACAAEGGTSMGPDTICATTECSSGPLVLFVVNDAANPTVQELARQGLMESWEFSVELIAASAWQSDFDEAVADVDVVYVSTTIDGASLGTKLRDVGGGVVNEDPDLVDEFGFAAGIGVCEDQSVNISDNTHYITSLFEIGQLAVYSSGHNVVSLSSSVAPGNRVLATQPKPVLSVLDAGADVYGGGIAAGRRVQLTWGTDEFDINALTADGQTIMKRAIEWAAGMETVCGDGDCDVGEECDCPDDCGSPAAFEEPGVTCDDGVDNDCDGQTDCDDINCSATPECVVCGNSLCEFGEDCNSCPGDCPGITGGKPADRYCCGNGVVESPEGDGTICDGNY